MTKALTPAQIEFYHANEDIISPDIPCWGEVIRLVNIVLA